MRRRPTSPPDHVPLTMPATDAPTLDALMLQAIARLRAAGDDSPHVCARALAQAATGLDRTGLLLAGNTPPAPDQAARFLALVARRCHGEPLAHILGQREFYGRDFTVSPATLIPRPETERLVELALDHMRQQEALLDAAAPPRLADLGTGSGCIGITLLCERPRWQALLMDISPAALAIARRNAHIHHVAPRALCLLGDMLAPPLAPRRLHLLVSNPPYIAPDERPEVMPEVLRHEPHTALFSPENGLAHLRAVCRAARHALIPGGVLLLEHGWQQGPAVRSLLTASGFVSVASHADLAGHERCTQGIAV